MQAVKKAGEGDREEERKAVFRRGRPLSGRYSAQIRQFSLLPEETTRRKHSPVFRGLASARLKTRTAELSEEPSSVAGNHGKLIPQVHL